MSKRSLLEQNVVPSLNGTPSSWSIATSWITQTNLGETNS
jgi:hypothetical protein